jgi:nucleoside 2-deoxyribosyltransferase
MRMIYVAGPFRANNSWSMEQNIRRAEAIALELWLLGAAVLCPHANTRFFQGAAPDDVWLTGDLEMLGRCDAVVLAENWEKSSGTKAEIDYARLHNIPVFEWNKDRDAVVKWIRNEVSVTINWIEQNERH